MYSSYLNFKMHSHDQLNCIISTELETIYITAMNMQHVQIYVSNILFTDFYFHGNGLSLIDIRSHVWYDKSIAVCLDVT